MYFVVSAFWKRTFELKITVVEPEYTDPGKQQADKKHKKIIYIKIHKRVSRKPHI